MIDHLITKNVNYLIWQISVRKNDVKISQCTKIVIKMLFSMKSCYRDFKKAILDFSLYLKMLYIVSFLKPTSHRFAQILFTIHSDTYHFLP
jgi:hypothetical protein